VTPGNAAANAILARQGRAPAAPAPPEPATTRGRVRDRCRHCGDNRCQICTVPDCGLRYCQHHACEVCGDALEHRRTHPGGVTTDEEWEGRARMAAAGRAAGRPLTPVEAKALAMFPTPARLTADGYRRPTEPAEGRAS
jgi:hypothetical protein